MVTTKKAYRYILCCNGYKISFFKMGFTTCLNYIIIITASQYLKLFFRLPCQPVLY